MSQGENVESAGVSLNSTCHKERMLEVQVYLLTLCMSQGENVGSADVSPNSACHKERMLEVLV